MIGNKFNKPQRCLIHRKLHDDNGTRRLENDVYF